MVMDTEPVKPIKAPPINKQNARELQARSVIARKAKRLAALNPAPAIASPMQIADPFIEEQLADTRAQIKLLSKELLSDLKHGIPPLDLEKKTRSLASLREEERKLAGRSLPATLKALVVKDKRQKLSDLPQPE